MNPIDRVLTGIKERRQRIIDGGINCIPTPFPSFEDCFPGVEQGKYYIVTAATKGAKSQFASYLFLYVPILFAYENPDKIRLQIFYLNLEETQDKIILRFMSYLLYTKHKIRISPLRLWSVIQGQQFDSEIIDILESPEIKNILYFFNDSIHFIEDRNPTGCWKSVNKYALEAGKVHKKTIFIENKETGVKQERLSFDYYEPKDKDEYVIVFVDHAGRLEQERGMTKKETIDKLSEYLMVFRDHYNYTPVLIQQQNSDTLSLDAYKAKKIRPTYNGLMDTKQTGQDSSLVLGLTCPHSFEVPEYLGYNIRNLKGYARFLEVVLNREGESNNILPLYFDGATNFFVPLPNAKDLTNLQKVYKLVEDNSK